MNNKKQIIGLLFQNSKLDYYKEKYEYYYIKNQGKIKYSTFAGDESSEIEIKDTVKFTEDILGIVANWQAEYKNKKEELEGILWSLLLSFSDDTELIFDGCDDYPENFKDLDVYLKNIVADYIEPYNKQNCQAFDTDMISRCKQLQPINYLEDVLPFYKKFYELKLQDVNYAANIKESYERKEIKDLDLQGVLTSFTLIHRDEYWFGGDGFIFKTSLENKYFEKLYSRMQELISEAKNK